MRLGEILNLQLEATKKSLQEKGRPTYTVEIDRLNEESMAELYASYMMLCSMVGALHKIDPFDQPGVERGKEIFQDFL